jgi:hypothetical protein
MAEPPAPLVDVVVVSYNSRATLRDCVEPLAAAPADAVAADVAGNLQRYLTGPLPSDG